MTSGYRLTPQARDGFLRIALYVEKRFGLTVAERVVGELERAFEALAANSGTGHRREDLTQDRAVFFWSVGPTLMAYRSSAEGVEVLFVDRADLDCESLLAKHLRP